ncbi:diguanylate cyclase domain-containing protein [Candidatus Ferrigenium straubiae]|uniref:diguanylate cyclase domain-containing protein n=1 Tax=Candidatus Ferrigenium straubiae TaxID=2919506 RepID=UPI003F4A9A07
MQKIHGYPVLIIGAGRGGSALLEMFLEDSLVKVVAMVDTNPGAAGLQLARKHGIPTYNNAAEALQACRNYPDCIVYNLSHDDSIAEEATRVFGDKRVAGGAEVKLFWQMVTNLKQVKGELEKSQDQLQSIIQNVMDGIITISESGQIKGFNPAAEQIFGYLQQEVLGKNVKMLMPEPDRSQHDTYISHYLQTGRSRIIGVRGREVTALRKSGEQFPLEISISEMMLGELRYFIGIVRDITERKLVEQQLAHFAHHDYLTGLPNRILFLNSLENLIHLAKRNKYKVATLFLDLDGFKQVNDTLGHGAGDQLLQEVAERLKEVIRASDVVARVGGDEFTFALNNIGSEQNAALMANKIIAALSAPFDLDGRQCHIGGSIGISTYPDDSEGIEKLIMQADAAMYLAKQSGKNTYRFCRDVPPKPAGE